jgi:Raf kinase inhibitor-like YbhB/YbcL family protein
MRTGIRSGFLNQSGTSLLRVVLLAVLVGCRIPAASDNPAVAWQTSVDTSDHKGSKWGGHDMSMKTSTLTLTSSAFQQQGVIPARYTCDGQNISPPLTVGGVPQDAQTLALVVHDPDAPGGNWDHWVLWNIPANLERLEEGQTPPGAVTGMNDFKQQGYGGPCPPSGTHRYIFTLYALDSPLTLSAGVRRHELEQAMAPHILARTELIGVYRRQ